MSSPRLTRSKSFNSVEQLKVAQVQEKITQKYAAPKRTRQNSLRIAVLKKNYRKRLIEEINERVNKSTVNSDKKVEEIPKKEVEKSSKMMESSSRLTQLLSGKVEKSTENQTKGSENISTLHIGKLDSGKSLVKQARLTAEPKEVKAPVRSKSFSSTTKPVVEVRKPTITTLDLSHVPKPLFGNEKSSSFSLFRKQISQAASFPPTPTKQRPQPEPLSRPKFGFSGRSLFSNGNKSHENSKKILEKSSTFYVSSEAAMNHTEKLNQINEKLKYVKQLERDFNDNKLKRQKDEDEVENDAEEKKSKRRLSFGKNPLLFLVQGGRS